MIAHQTVGQHQGIEAIQCPGNDSQERRAIRIANEDRFGPVTPEMTW